MIIQLSQLLSISYMKGKSWTQYFTPNPRDVFLLFLYGLYKLYPIFLKKKAGKEIKGPIQFQNDESSSKRIDQLLGQIEFLRNKIKDLTHQNMNFRQRKNETSLIDTPQFQEKLIQQKQQKKVEQSNYGTRQEQRKMIQSSHLKRYQNKVHIKQSQMSSQNSSNKEKMIFQSGFSYSIPPSILSQPEDEQINITNSAIIQSSLYDKLKQFQYQVECLKHDLAKCKAQKENLIDQCIEKTAKIEFLKAEAKEWTIQQLHCQQKKEGSALEFETTEQSNEGMKSQQSNQTGLNFKSKESSFNLLLSLFNASTILPNYRSFDEAVEVRKQIASMFGSKVRCSEAVYAYDALTPTHCHQYIEGRQNLLFLIKLPNDVVLGAFAGKVTENTHAESFVFSLSAQRTPMKLSASKAIHRIEADRSYIVFGNGEIRIKAKSLELHSNLGSFQGLYTLNGKAVDYKVFMETKEREITMRTYEVHQIQFQE